MRAQKEDFFGRLALSLVFKSHNGVQSPKENKLWTLFIKNLYEHPAMGTSALYQHVVLKLIEGGGGRGGGEGEEVTRSKI